MSVQIVRNALLAAGALAWCSAASSSHAQSAYPSQTIKIVVPNPPGGLPDTISRIVGKRLQERLGQSVVIENRPGASAGIGAATLTAAPADGYTLLVTDGAILSTNPLLSAKLPYNPQDILPVAFIARAPLFLATNANVAAADLKALIDHAKASPGKLNYGSIGVGSFHHLSMEALNAALGLSMNHIPYKGSGESIGALLGGHIDLLFAAYSGLRPAVESKKVRILATNGGQRSPQAPEIPSVAEVAPGLDLAVIQGIMARVGTPDEVVRKIAGEIAAIVKEPEVMQQFAVAGIEPVGAGPEQYRAALAKEAERMAQVVQAAGLKPQ
ncbi:MAG: tripartite tricarboxylate transporter substrate binding protein [Hyphomicrobiales bacterium]|nr:tripartite tricarboxylate transporter substrate binding protein [Hyphomicrobiales bacterium]